jgi:hypothetical protein
VERRRHHGDVQLMARVTMWLGLALATVGCSRLPDIPLGVCGNHVVEAGEDCDSADPACVPPGQPDECRRRCSAFADGVCPAGAICDGNGACVLAVGACGNHVVEAGEDCDGQVGCIAPGQPGACHMSCTAYSGGVCPPQQICDGDGACVAAPDRCGNGFVDPGEECDGTAGCIAAGAPDACKLACAAHDGGHCPAGTVCDTHGACAVAANVCGNLVVEPGEDCDGTVGCGAPGTSAACRFSCAGGVACAHGLVCGNDLVCRQPTGRFRLGAPFGRGDEAFQLVDLDGDGVRDVVARGPHRTTLYRNDGHGALAVMAQGTTPPRPIDQPVLSPPKSAPWPSPGVALTRDGDTNLLVALSPSGADLYRLFQPSGGGAAQLQPMVTPTRRFYSGDPTRSLVGIVTYRETSYPNELTSATLFRRTTGGKDYLELQPWSRSQAWSASVVFDVAQVCGVSGSSRRVQMTAHGATIEIVVIIDDRYLCFGESTLGYFSPTATWQTIDVSGEIAQLNATGWWQEIGGNDPHVGQATFLDVNGDGRLDVGVSFRQGDGSQASAFVYWERQADGSWPAKPVVSLDGLRAPLSAADPVAAADLDGDKRDDLVYAGELSQSTVLQQQQRSWDYFYHRSNYAYPPVRATDTALIAFGDVSGDQRVDLVQAFSTRPDVSVCRQTLSSGFPALGCIDEPSGLATIAGLTLADVSGDGRADMLTWGRGTPANGGRPTLSVILGSDAGTDAPAPLLLPGYHATVVAGARGEPVGAGTTAWLVVTGDDGTYYLAQSHGSSSGDVSFGWDGGSPVDIRVQDFDGDGALDVAGLGIGVDLIRGPKLDTTLPIGGAGEDETSRFLDLPGEPYPLVFESYGTGQEIGWYAPTTYFPYQFSQTGLSGSQWSAKVQDVDGDGAPEIVIFDPDCDVYVGTWANHLLTPRLVGERPAGYTCDDVFFFDAAPKDGVPDLVYEVRGRGDTTSHLLLTRARADGTYDAVHAVLDPPLADGSAGATALPAGSKWVGSADLDGDGVADFVFWTPDGAIVAFGEVTRP